MATPVLTKHSLPGQLGPILIDARAGKHMEPVAAVLVLHGFKGFKDWGMFPPLSDRLAKAGFTTISYNVSGSGADDSGQFTLPERFGHNTFTAELEDFATVLDAVDGGMLGFPKPASVGVIGHSRGGGIAILAAAGRPRVSALVTWAAIASVNRWPDPTKAEWRRRGVHEVKNMRTGEILPMYPETLDDVERNAAGSLDILAAATRLRCPWLIVHGSGDEAVPVAEAEQLAAAAPAAERLTLPGAGHTLGAVHPWRGSTPDLDRALNATTSFFGKHLA
ncbi:MAG: alpha/beta fold hydrolase [Gemmatimonadota bacterium]